MMCRAGIELATPGSAVRLASVARHLTYYHKTYFSFIQTNAGLMLRYPGRCDTALSNNFVLTLICNRCGDGLSTLEINKTVKNACAQ